MDTPLPPPPPLDETQAAPIIPAAWEYVGGAYAVMAVAMLWLVLRGYSRFLAAKRRA